MDGLVTLAGGSGTLEELLEAITLKRLGQFTKPIIILNTNGFYNPLREMLERCVAENFMDERHLAMWTFVDEPELEIVGFPLGRVIPQIPIHLMLTFLMIGY